ncbi:hypothetical protein OIU78_005975 [Salix suchowensis]|nr:hypothetical protein OIU78_005975 [Salix suchowensis]
MGKKQKEDASGAPSKAKAGNKDAKKEKLSVTAMLASMDQKPDKPKKGSSSAVTSSKPKSAPSYIDGIDFPPSDDEEEQQKNDPNKRPSQRRSELKPLDVAISDKELKKREKKEVLATHAIEHARQEALKDDHDAFTVVIGSRASVLDGEDEAHGRRYGLVGPNGMGKSTLLKLLAWRKIPVPKNIDVLLVEQEVIGDDKTALQAVVSANEELVKLREEVASLLKSDGPAEGENNGDGYDEDDSGERLAELYENLQLMGSDAAESQASKILAGLGFTKDMQGRPTRSFSGGWRMRISLARALFVQPTLLLLDEPTNHLDLRAVLWLEEYLCRWKKTLVVVSHDRDFLNTVCNDIIHLHDQKLDSYRGNFDDFEVGYEQRRKETNKKFEIYDKQMKAAKRSGNRVQQEKVKDRAKFVAAKEAAKNKSKAKLIEVSFSYPNREDFKLSNVDVGIDMGTRVAIVGPNGAGKSTLLNLLAGDLVPTEGETKRGLANRRLFGGSLAKFGLPSHNHLTPIAKLSGGQKARVVFTSISMSKPHILLLDEPTNHLDMQSIDALADALDEFTGGVVLVSHDSRLISRVCEDEEKSEIWVVEDGTVTAFPGTFEEYKEELQKEIKAEVDD